MQSDGNAGKYIAKIANRITAFTERVESIKGKKIEIIVLLLFAVTHILMMLVHEPWFDEALAWLIAKDSSLHEILFTAPHYEGHPALWHLVLFPFAKLGAPYELCLSMISLVFTGIAMMLVIYKSPFKRIIRLLIPFTYFVFYQYSVVSRPYCMMVLAMALVAVTYKKRDIKPGRFVMSLIFLCMTGAYGIVISGGICIAWIYCMLSESWKKSRNKNSGNGEYRGTFRIFVEDGLLAKGKILWLGLILVYAVFTIVRIIPEEDTYAVMNAEGLENSSLIFRLLYTFFGIAADSFITNTFSETRALSSITIPVQDLVIGTIVGLIIIIAVIWVSKKKSAIVEFLIPYVLMSSFMAVVYLFNTHIGIMFVFLGFWFWVLGEKKECDESKSRALKEKKINPNAENSLQVIKNTGELLLTFAFFMLLYWNISSCICDIIYDYGSGRGEYEFLKENGLEKEMILPEWTMINAETDKGSYFLSKEGVSIAPYLDRGTLLISPDVMGYSYVYTHKMIADSDMNAQGEKIMNSGMPKVLLGNPDLQLIYHNKNINIGDFTKVFEKRSSVIFKGVPGPDSSAIYVLNSIAEEKGLTH